MSVYQEPDLRYDRSRTAVYAAVGVVLALAVLAFFYFVSNQRISAAPITTTVASLTSDPNRLLNRSVVLSGRVGMVLNGSAFTISDPNMATPQALVISRVPIPPVAGRPTNPGLMIGDQVSAHGQVRRLTRDDQLMTASLSPSDYERFAGSPVIIAQTVVPPGGSAVVVTPNAGYNLPRGTDTTTFPRQPVYTGKASPNDPRLEVRTVRTDHRRLLNRRAQFVGAVVTEVDSDRGFWIAGSTPERLFVVLSEGLDAGPVEWLVTVKPGQTVTVNGIISALPDIRTLQTKWKMSSDAAAALAKEQVYLLADGMHIRNP